MALAAAEAHGGSDAGGPGWGLLRVRLQVRRVSVRVRVRVRVGVRVRARVARVRARARVRVWVRVRRTVHNLVHEARRGPHHAGIAREWRPVVRVRVGVRVDSACASPAI